MMTRKGESPCHNLFCLALTGSQGRAQRKSGMLSWYQPITTWFPRKSRFMLSTPRTTSEHPRVPIRTKKLLRHTREDTTVGVHGPQHHHNGHELHLGQKPKLGGRYTDITLIYISYSIGSLYIHVSFSFFLLLFLFCSCFPKHKRPKIFLLFLFGYFFGSLFLVCSTF